MEISLKPLMWALPLATIGWAYHHMKKKAKGDFDADDISYPVIMDHSRDKLR
jgi:hypothetical protein